MKSEEIEGTKWCDKQDEGRSTNVFLMGVDRGGGGHMENKFMNVCVVKWRLCI